MITLTVARKPLVGTVARNVREHGTGGLNIDGCRVGTSKRIPASESKTAGKVYGSRGIGPNSGAFSGFDPNVGRWPANILIEHPDALLKAADQDPEAAFFFKRVGS